MSDKILTVYDLHKNYYFHDQCINVLKGIDLELESGLITTLQGVSGVGKSTLLNIIGTLDNPDQGSVFYKNEDVFKLTKKMLLKFRNMNIGFIYQFHHLLAEFSALENVMIPCLIGGMQSDKARQEARNLLAEVGLEHRLAHRPRELSGGEQQRVAVARALVNNPMLVLADEPTGNLDSSQSGQLFNLLYKFSREMNKTFLIATHSNDIAGKSDRVLRMVDGAIA
ncbi:MAG: ABC transporter ATP-binding protein [bacterium]